MEPIIKKDNENTNWYETLLEDYDYQNPKPGDLLKGTIITLGEDEILIDVGLKRDAVVGSRDLEFISSKLISSLSVGDEVSVVVLNRLLGDQGFHVSLSKGIEYQSWQRAEKHLQNNDNLVLEIIGHNRGGLLVDFENLNGFLPFSQVPEIRSARNSRVAETIKKEMIGTQIEVKVIEVVRERNRLIFSALAALQEKRKTRLAELEMGEIIHGKVVNVVDFGVFVDLDGVDGLVHISQLDWTKVKHPSEVLNMGEEIQVKVTNVDVERGRVSLSRKALLPSPWDTIGDTYQINDYVEGVVKRVLDFGAFVELPIGIEGLIHISQLGYSASQNPQNAVRKGERVLVRILNIDEEKKRMALSMRQVPIERQIAWAMENLPSPEISQPPEEAGQTSDDSEISTEPTDEPQIDEEIHLAVPPSDFEPSQINDRDQTEASTPPEEDQNVIEDQSQTIDLETEEQIES